ncbi:MAG: hypothetical protein LBD11_02735 [Candidatus Peribacteria bacterium]|nr:hypothetical protein [Candidatus Peribacteria bacterium]
MDKLEIEDATTKEQVLPEELLNRSGIIEELWQHRLKWKSNHPKAKIKYYIEILYKQ